MRIRDWMTQHPLTVTATTSVRQARDLMLYRKIRHLPVLADGQKLVGIITDRDVRTVLPSPATTFTVGEIRFLFEKLTVGEVMTRSVITVGPDEPLAEAVRLMRDNKIGGLPVVAEGRLAGILTETDVLSAFAAALNVPDAAAQAPAVNADAAPRRKILLPLDGADGSQAAVARVGEIARAEASTVRLLHVAPRVHEIRAEDKVVVFADQEAARIEAEARAYLKRVARTLGNVPIELAVRFGDPAEEIVKDAEEVGVDLIAMATHRRTGLARLVLGSVAERVEHHTSVPVMLIRYGAPVAA